MGGYYCDTDYKWLASPDKFSLNECICILPISRGQKDNIECLGNAVFGSEPKIEFWKDFIDYLFQDSEISQLQENRIEKVTGPEGLTKFSWPTEPSTHTSPSRKAICFTHASKEYPH